MEPLDAVRSCGGATRSTRLTTLTLRGEAVLRFDRHQVVRQRGWWLSVVRDVHPSGPPPRSRAR